MPAAPRLASTAQIHPAVRLGADVEVGQFCVIEADVELGDGARIGHHVVLHAGSRLGAGVRVDDGAVVGKQPMRAARSATTRAESLSPAVVGEGSLVGTGAVLYAGCRIGRRVLVADYATVRERVTVGDETIVGRGVAVENDCTVGARCKLETNAYVTAFTTIEDDVFVAPGVLTSNDRFMGRTEERKKHFGGPVVRRGARLGVGAVLLPGKEVAEEAVVAAGAVLTRDAEAGHVHVGVPARPIRPVPPEQRLPGKDERRAPGGTERPTPRS
jgi:acetyltransferase-like isoleucine patch superfamily enzyme